MIAERTISGAVQTPSWVFLYVESACIRGTEGEWDMNPGNIEVWTCYRFQNGDERGVLINNQEWVARVPSIIDGS